jgi:hypothetical protein
MLSVHASAWSSTHSRNTLPPKPESSLSPAMNGHLRTTSVEQQCSLIDPTLSLPYGKLPCCTEDGSDCCPLQCRPDSPTSLEDSHSESGTDSSSPETTDTEHSIGPFLNDDDVTIAHSKAIITEQLNIVTPMSTLQVATPPLFPANLPPFDELLDQHLIEDDSQGYMFGAEITESLPYERSRTSARIEVATAAVQPPPRMYGWPIYFPGAPFVPMPKTGSWYSGRPRGTRKPNHLRLHERFPIVLPPEAEAKLSMEMVDLFEVIMKVRSHH